MGKNNSSQISAENNLIMECQEDDLSSAQVNAYKKKKEAYMTASKTLQVVTANANVIYENSSWLVVSLKKPTSASQSIKILPDTDIFHSSIRATNYSDSHFMKLDSSLNVTKQSRFNIKSLKKSVPNKEISGKKNILNSASRNLKEYKPLEEKTYQLIVNKTLGVGSTTNNKYQEKSILLDNFCNKNLSHRLNINAGKKTVISPSIATSNNHLMPLGLEDNTAKIPFNNKKMFPSLLVVTRPCLFAKNITQRILNEENLYLNEKVKLILRLSESMFVEWLMKQGMIRSEQYCTEHSVTESREVKLKLGMYSDKTKFLYSGGYVWISDCCPISFTSVFKRSIFEDLSCSPKDLLKLIYHWACQTNVNNVIEWLTTDTSILKKFYTAFRAACIAAVHEECKGLLGGNNKMVEVGVVSLGIVFEGNVRKTKAWILGAMESDTKFLRLHVVDPINYSQPNIEQFKKMLEPLLKSVRKDSIILTDLTLSNEVFLSLGYKSIFRSPVQISVNKTIHSNDNLMDYLNKCIPRMFQNSLSLLSKQVIQQFLDELTWRERWGQSALRVFHSLISHIEKQTKIDCNATLYSCLLKIAANPFMDWQYNNWKTNFKILNEKPQGKTYHLNTKTANKLHSNVNMQNNQSKEKLVSQVSTVSDLSAPMITLASNGKMVPQDLQKLENYYYGQLDGDKYLLDQEKKCYLQMKCVLCSTAMNTNISMMKHLINHALCLYKNNVENSKWCKYCLQQFKDDENLIKHVHETHFKTIKPTLTCLICETDFKYRTKLILHMHCSHNEVEMPYECSICKFRSSQHRHVIDHFYEKHNNCGKAQCPLCLKVVAFKDNDKKITQNIYFFLNHIKKHACKKLVKKCKRCVLSFINKSVLEYHYRAHHKSCRDVPNVKRHDTIYTVLMPVPYTGPFSEQYKCNKIPEKFNNLYTCKKLSLTIDIHTSAQNMCCECEGFIEEDNHFPGILSCHKCLYKTCCEKSMIEHIIKFHDNGSRNILNIGRQIILNRPMHCLCGFKSKSGDKLAHHISQCKKKSVYPMARTVNKNCNTNTEKELLKNKPISDAPKTFDVTMDKDTEEKSVYDSEKICEGLKQELEKPEISSQYTNNISEPPVKKLKIE